MLLILQIILFLTFCFFIFVPISFYHEKEIKLYVNKNTQELKVKYYCSKCGKEVSKDETRCPNCGRHLKKY